MALPNIRPVTARSYRATMPDITTATAAGGATAFIRIFGRGKLVEAGATCYTAIAGADAVLTIKKGATTIGTITVPVASAAAGQTAVTVLTTRTFVDDGDVISFTSDGGPNDAVGPAGCHILVDEGQG